MKRQVIALLLMCGLICLCASLVCAEGIRKRVNPDGSIHYEYIGKPSDTPAERPPYDKPAADKPVAQEPQKPAVNVSESVIAVPQVVEQKKQGVRHSRKRVPASEEE